MEIALEKTNSARIARALVKARVAAGSPAMDMAFTLLVVTDDENVAEALKTATTLSREHPSRVIGVILGDGRGAAELNAKVRVGENSSGESILLRISGELTKHAESVVLPLLLPDSPIVVWWPGKPPTNPSEDAIGKLAQRRLTDAEATDSPIRSLKAVARKYVTGRHRPVLDPPDAVARAARGRPRPVDRQGHWRHGRRRSGQPGRHAARGLAREPPQGRRSRRARATGRADRPSCSTPHDGDVLIERITDHVVPFQRAGLITPRGAARRSYAR